MILSERYLEYIECINDRNLIGLEEFVDKDVKYNGSIIGLEGYRTMLAGNYEDIPDLKFVVDLLVADTATVASRLHFHCKPKGEFRGLPINGRLVDFYENVFYKFNNSKIAEVWSVIDKAEVEDQLAAK